MEQAITEVRLGYIWSNREIKFDSNPIVVIGTRMGEISLIILRVKKVSNVASVSNRFSVLSKLEIKGD